MTYWFFSQWHQDCPCLQTIHFPSATVIYRTSKVWFNGVLLLCLAQFIKYFSQLRHTSRKLTANIIQIYNGFLDYKLLCIDIPRGKQRLRFHVVTRKRHKFLSVLYFTEKKSRKRRQMFNLAVLMKEAELQYPDIEKEELCSGGKGTITGNDLADCKYIQRKVWKVKCKEYTASCYLIRVCPLFDDCYRNHLINRSFCCEYICV